MGPASRLFFAGVLILFVSVGTYLISSNTSTKFDLPGLQNAELAPDRGYVSLTPTGLGTSPATLNTMCLADSLRLSPDGRLAVLFQNQAAASPNMSLPIPGRITVFNLECLATGIDAGQCGTIVEGLNGVTPLAWSGSGQSLFVMSGTRDLFRLDVDAQSPVLAVPAEKVSGEHLDRNKIVILGTVDTDKADGLSNLMKHHLDIANRQTSEEADLVRMFIKSGDHLGSLYEERPSLRLRVAVQSSSSPLPLKSVHALSPLLHMRSDRSFALAAMGILVMESGSADWVDAVVQPYEYPILSATSGNLLGTHTDSEIAVDENAFPKATRFIRDFYTPSMFISGVSMSDQGALAVIRRAVDGRAVVGAVLPDGNTISIPCQGNVHSKDISKATTEITIRDIDIGNIERRLHAKYYQKETEAQGLIVFLHGGPASTLGYGTSRGNIQRFLEFGWDVLAVEYSGSVGVGLDTSVRLPQGGIEELRKDMDAVAAFLVQRPAGSMPTVIHGESFGAMPAIMLAGSMQDKVSGLVLVAPFLLHRPPSTWTHDWPSGGYGPTYQEEFERAAIGVRSTEGPDSFRDGQHDVLAQWQSNTPVLAIFAEHDPVSKIDDLPVSVKKQALIVQQQATTHQLISAANGTWVEIRQFLSKLLSDEKK